MDNKKKILMVIAQKNFRDEEFLQPREIFENAGFDITVATNQNKVAKGMLGGKVKPDTTISSEKADSYDAIVISGGGGQSNIYGITRNCTKLSRMPTNRTN